MDINISQIDTIKNDKNSVIIDVRETDELELTGFLPGAEHYPMSTFNLEDADLDKDKDYYIVCKAGGRSKRVQDYMNAQGYTAHNVEGGMMEYTGPRDRLQ